MRRSDREVKNLDALMDIISICKVCRIAVNDDLVPYIVPLNFGYSFDGNHLILYFHSARNGRKINIFKKNNIVGFEMDCNHKLIEADKACQYGFAYASIIGNGKIQFIESSLEKIEALNFIMNHQCGKTFNFQDADIQDVCVFKIIVDTFTGKKLL